MAPAAGGTLPYECPPKYDTYSLTQFHCAQMDEMVPKLPPPPAQEPPVEHSGPQGNVKPFTIIDTPSAWTAADLKGKEDLYTYSLTETDIAELDAAIKAWEDAGRKDEEIKDVTVETFPLPTLGPKLIDIGKDVVQGIGFRLLRGLPVKRYTRAQTVLALFGMGKYWGDVEPENMMGHLMGHIRDREADATRPGARPSATNLRATWHTDTGGMDIIGLLCLQQGIEGGESWWTSSVSIHNRLITMGRMDLLKEAVEGDWWMPKTGFANVPEWIDEATGECNYKKSPIFVYHDGRLSTRYSAAFYYKVCGVAGAPPLTEKQVECINMISALAQSDEFRMDYQLTPGDIQLIHNSSIMHARSAFKSGPAEQEKRHLLRINLKSPHAPPSPASFGCTWYGNRDKWTIPLDVHFE